MDAKKPYKIMAVDGDGNEYALADVLSSNEQQAIKDALKERVAKTETTIEGTVLTVELTDDNVTICLPSDCDHFYATYTRVYGKLVWVVAVQLSFHV